MTEPKCSVFRFSDVEVHERELQLKRAGEALPVEPKAFRVRTGRKFCIFAQSMSPTPGVASESWAFAFTGRDVIDHDLWYSEEGVALRFVQSRSIGPPGTWRRNQSQRHNNQSDA